MRTEREDSLVRGLLSGVVVFRWLAWGWLVVILAVSHPDLNRAPARPWVAYTLAGAALAVTAATTFLRRTNPEALLTLPVLTVEVAVAFVLMAGDPVAYNGVAHPQSLGSAWPLAAILTAGMAFGSRGGLVAGVVVGSGRIVGAGFDPNFTGNDRSGLVSIVSTVVLYALAGGVAGFVMLKLRQAERRIGLAQAREEVARTLHDGVLQTLAIVQRRSADPALTRLAHDQERELREFLFGSPSTVDGGGDLGARLRTAAARFEDRYDARARVVPAPDLPKLSPERADAVVGAVTEALTNAGKHGQARTVTVYLEPHSTDGAVVFCSVKDDGTGFDATAVTEGIGLRRSVRGRITEVGGRVEIDGRPGRGTEVRLWV